jgi:hypothetical protein
MQINLESKINLPTASFCFNRNLTSSNRNLTPNSHYLESCALETLCPIPFLLQQEKQFVVRALLYKNACLISDNGADKQSPITPETPPYSNSDPHGRTR